ncbi:Small glutamine-rich tetratricopeptide repeat-containing protein 2 [Coemansia sp. RSA 2320]|nr:Small glutamine-rich tetratricopeptide repeat-containing protein 2 [Coemansia sp. RSA 2320]
MQLYHIGSVAGDGAESLEIAKQCISDAFGINLEDEGTAKELSLKPFSLDKVFGVYLSTQAKLGGSLPATEATTSGPSDDDKRRANEFKAEGNALVVAKDFAGAVDAYTKAIALVDDSAVYFGNRAAAYSQNGDHQKAIDDARRALAIDPNYSKGYSRLGLACFGMGNYEEAVAAYENGLKLDPANKIMETSLETARAKLAAASSSTSAARSAPAATSAAATAEPGAGGFDFASLMNNPAMMNMAQSMMANGGLERLMSNPAVAQLASNYRNTGQMPSMSDMMSNPDIMDMARNVGGSATDNSAADGGNAANPLASLLNNPNLASMAQQFMRGNQGSGDNNANDAPQ